MHISVKANKTPSSLGIQLLNSLPCCCSTESQKCNLKFSISHTKQRKKLKF